MSQIIENWTEVEGQVASTAPVTDKLGFVSLKLNVTRANDVPGHANLIGNIAGQTLEVRVPVDVMENAGIRVGDVVAMHAKRAGPPTMQNYANPATVVKR